MKAYSDYQKLDKQLGVVYQKVIKEYASDGDFIAALRASERLWIQFRDAEVKLKFPAMIQEHMAVCIRCALLVIWKN